MRNEKQNPVENKAKHSVWNMVKRFSPNFPKSQPNLTLAVEMIKLLFMYIMIHKLDLYINIAFHPNKDGVSQFWLRGKWVFNVSWYKVKLRRCQ